ncbi:MAG: sulfotransferase family 2 domain-containing protein [Ilumatobacteraceae bacterium]
MRQNRSGHVLVAEHARVLYVPTTKVASSTVRLILAEANGTYRPERLRWTDAPNVSVDQGIHNLQVSGLKYFEFFSESEREHMLTSRDWWRVGFLRDPYARLYSAWENRILLRAPNQRLKYFVDKCSDVLVDGRIDYGATFRKFVHVLRTEPEIFGADPHFKSQRLHLGSQVDFTHLLRVDQPGELESFATQLGQRVGKHIQPRRLNEGLGLKHLDVLDVETAGIIEEIYKDDFDNYGFDKVNFPSVPPTALASIGETRAINYAREVTARLIQLSQLARYRLRTRHLVVQMLHNLGLRRRK